MNLRIVGAGLPRTGTSSLKAALERLLGGRCYHMSVRRPSLRTRRRLEPRVAGKAPDWDRLFDGYVAAVDWPASIFWRELSEANPDALVLLSLRDTAAGWLRSFHEMILPIARLALTADWNQGRDLPTLLERFTGTERWDDPATLKAAYDRHNAEVRQTVPPQRLLEWRAPDGWAPICRSLDVPVPDLPFPHIDGRSTKTK